MQKSRKWLKEWNNYKNDTIKKSGQVEQIEHYKKEWAN